MATSKAKWGFIAATAIAGGIGLGMWVMGGQKQPEPAAVEAPVEPKIIPGSDNPLLLAKQDMDLFNEAGWRFYQIGPETASFYRSKNIKDGDDFQITKGSCLIAHKDSQELLRTVWTMSGAKGFVQPDILFNYIGAAEDCQTTLLPAKTAQDARRNIEQMPQAPRQPEPVAGDKVRCVFAEVSAYLRPDRVDAIVKIPKGTNVTISSAEDSEFAYVIIPEELNPYVPKGYVSKRALRVPGGCN